ncbi:MAG: 16S rRNA (uracil(1498)-N(3))-methyltransferase [Bacteroidales bacterium]|nr:16S rRNA (uracil(1498)-N(3))-methyltransferase [Bacteroidales bacterium]
MELFYCKNASDGVFTLDEEESVHCVRVLRHKAGERINVIDGSGTLYVCELLEANPKGAACKVQVASSCFGAHPYRLTMAVCPTKNIDRYEWFCEKATEIGVDVIATVIGEHSERKVVKTDRLRRLVLSATKQSLKGALPEIPEPVSVRDFILGAPSDAVKLICYCFDGDKHSIPEILASERFHRNKPLAPTTVTPDPIGHLPEIMILIGPEGDFSPAEAELALASGWIPVTLGSSRLRTETAALVAVTQVYTCLGD